MGVVVYFQDHILSKYEIPHKYISSHWRTVADIQSARPFVVKLLKYLLIHNNS